MNLLKKLENKDLGFEQSGEFVVQKERKAARAVIFHPNGKVALMFATNDNYYKLPGGGVENDESYESAVLREAIEEVGTEVELTAEVGEIIEERFDEGFRQTSRCYLANQVGEIGKPELTEKEKAAGLEVIWANDIEHAIQLVDDGSPENGGGKFMKARDGAFLRTAKELLKQ